MYLPVVIFLLSVTCAMLFYIIYLLDKRDFVRGQLEEVIAEIDWLQSGYLDDRPVRERFFEIRGCCQLAYHILEKLGGSNEDE